MKCPETDAKMNSGAPRIEGTPETLKAGAEVLQSEVFDSIHWDGGYNEQRGQDVALAIWKAMCAKGASVS